MSALATRIVAIRDELRQLEQELAERLRDALLKDELTHWNAIAIDRVRYRLHIAMWQLVGMGELIQDAGGPTAQVFR